MVGVAVGVGVAVVVGVAVGVVVAVAVVVVVAVAVAVGVAVVVVVAVVILNLSLFEWVGFVEPGLNGYRVVVRPRRKQQDAVGVFLYHSMLFAAEARAKRLLDRVSGEQRLNLVLWFWAPSQSGGIEALSVPSKTVLSINPI